MLSSALIIDLHVRTTTDSHQFFFKALLTVPWVPPFYSCYLQNNKARMYSAYLTSLIHLHPHLPLSRVRECTGPAKCIHSSITCHHQQNHDKCGSIALSHTFIFQVLIYTAPFIMVLCKEERTASHGLHVMTNSWPRYK